jgi:RNA polymerase sigma factor (sigma-70 family)
VNSKVKHADSLFYNKWSIYKVRTEDGHLVYKCLNGEPELFGILVDKYKAGIYAFVYNKLRNFHDAEDVTQEVFLNAFKDLRKLKNFDSFAIWLSSIASNLIKKWMRSKIRRPDGEFIEDKNPNEIKEPSTESSSENEISESLHIALNSLPEIYRQVLTLHYLGDMSGMEIARTLGISHDTVRQRLSRAREQLKEEMIAMMNQTFQQQKLSASFTFRIAEMVKKIKINPISDARNLPWGLSIGAGLIFTVLMFGQHIPFNLPDIAMGLPLPSDMKILKVGEIPVDAVKVSTISSIGNKGDGKGIMPDPKGQENAFFMAPQGEGKWTNKADMPTARSWVRTAVANGKIYAVGGIDWGGPITNFEEYDPVKDKWEIRSNMPKGKWRHYASSVNGKIYEFGGQLDGNGNQTFSVYEYDPVLDKWTAKKDMPVKMFGGCACALNSKIYTFGGNSEGGNMGDGNDVYEFDPTEDSWTRKADMPTLRYFHGVSPVNGKIYVIGGSGPGGYLSTVEEYDPVADTWERKSDMPTRRAYLEVCAVGTKIYAMGGQSSNSEATTTVEIYDTLTNTWAKGVDMQIPRYVFSASVVDGKIYAIGGFNGVNILSDVEEFDPGFISKSVDQSGKLRTIWGGLKTK